MSYEEAPATALVATACCICGRALVEAESIASGIGPVCAEKTGFGRADIAPSVRAEVNKLVYELAAIQRSTDAVPRIERLRELGFGKIADRIEDRIGELITIRVELVDGVGLVVEIPRITDTAVFSALVADLRTVPGRRWREVPGRAGKVNVVPNDRASIHALYRALARTFPGQPTKSPRGLFLMPSPDGIDAAFAPRRRPNVAA
jgi:hypothetical protein